MGRGGGQVVSMPDFNLDGPSLNPAEVYSSYSVTLHHDMNKKSKKRPLMANFYNTLALSLYGGL